MFFKNSKCRINMAVAPTFTAYNSPFLSARNTGLGNVLFQLACAYGISRKIGKQISYHNLINYGNKLHALFGFNHKDKIFRNFTHIIDNVQWNTVQQQSNTDYDPNIELQCRNNTYIQTHGYFECFEYFKDVSSDFIELIRPDSDSLSFIQHTYPFLFDSNINTVAIHIRLHEYTNIYNRDYYIRAIAYIKERIESPMFLIFTDNPTADFSDLGISDYKIMTTQYDYMDLWTLSFCKHFICSYSTFCVWATMLNTYADSIILGCNDDPYKRMHNTTVARSPRSILI